MATGASVAIGFATVATVLGIRLADADDQVAHLQGAIDETARTEVVAALETAGHRTDALIDAHHRDVMQFVVRPNGRGYLVTSRLPALSSGETYQLWGIIHGKTISLGLLGRTPHLAVFTAAGSLRPHALGCRSKPAVARANRVDRCWPTACRTEMGLFAPPAIVMMPASVEPGIDRRGGGCGLGCRLRSVRVGRHG